MNKKEREDFKEQVEIILDVLKEKLVEMPVLHMAGSGGIFGRNIDISVAYIPRRK